MALECPKSLIQITADSHFTARDDATQTTSTAITLLASNEMKRVNDGGTATESAKLLSDDDDYRIPTKIWFRILYAISYATNFLTRC